MKKLLTISIILVLTLTFNCFSQEDTDPDNSKIKPALLVIDIQNAYLEMIPEHDKEIGFFYINALIDLFRENGFPVIRVYHYSKEYGPAKGTEGFEFPESIHIQPQDPKVIKTYADGFNKTDLDQVIRETGSNTLFLTGISAVGCVLATLVGAQNHDFDAFMVKHAIMSHNTDFTNQAADMFDAVSLEVVQMMLKAAEN